LGEVTILHPGAPRISPPAALDFSFQSAENFDCGKPPLNNWLRIHAAKSEGRGARTFVVCDGPRIVGYYALASGAVEQNRAPKNIARNMPDPIPVIILGRLAVDKAYHGRNIGSGLLKDALKRAANASKEIGARAVIVHALDDESVGFYLQYKFKPFPTDPRTLYMPINHIVDAL
jgi:GNAT superfamily N-acetyltransferase